jgi:hypothetical protein
MDSFTQFFLSARPTQDIPEETINETGGYCVLSARPAEDVPEETINQTGGYCVIA